MGEDCVMDDVTLIPLVMEMTACATMDERNANVDATMARGYTRLNEYLGAYSGTLSIVGAGPSLAATHKDLSGDIMAVNSSIGYLLERGIVPKFGMIWDASALCEKFAIPHPEVTYLIALRCHPLVFQRLQGCKQINWHPAGDHNIADLLSLCGIMEPLVMGGSAGVTRGLYLGVALGYTNFHLYGADSSIGEDGATHVAGSVAQEKELPIWVAYKNGEKRRFRTTPEMAAQVDEYLIIHPQFSAMGIPIEIHGGGMMGYVHELLERERAVA